MVWNLKPQTHWWCNLLFTHVHSFLFAVYVGYRCKDWAPHSWFCQGIQGMAVHAFRKVQSDVERQEVARHLDAGGVKLPSQKRRSFGGWHYHFESPVLMAFHHFSSSCCQECCTHGGSLRSLMLRFAIGKPVNTAQVHSCLTCVSDQLLWELVKPSALDVFHITNRSQLRLQ